MIRELIRINFANLHSPLFIYSRDDDLEKTTTEAAVLLFNCFVDMFESFSDFINEKKLPWFYTKEKKKVKFYNL